MRRRLYGTCSESAPGPVRQSDRCDQSGRWSGGRPSARHGAIHPLRRLERRSRSFASAHVRRVRSLAQPLRRVGHQRDDMHVALGGEDGSWPSRSADRRRGALEWCSLWSVEPLPASAVDCRHLGHLRERPCGSSSTDTDAPSRESSATTASRGAWTSSSLAHGYASGFRPGGARPRASHRERPSRLPISSEPGRSCGSTHGTWSPMAPSARTTSPTPS